MSTLNMPPKKDMRLVAPLPWWEAVDDWRLAQPDAPNLSESIRRLVLAGIEAERIKRQPSKP
jgi:hypothetical protein